MVRRRYMKPGTMFRVTKMVAFCGTHFPMVLPDREVWVVIDRYHEIGFWSGTLAIIGNVASSVAFEVV